MMALVLHFLIVYWQRAFKFAFVGSNTFSNSEWLLNRELSRSLRLSCRAEFRICEVIDIFLAYLDSRRGLVFSICVLLALGVKFKILSQAEINYYPSSQSCSSRLLHLQFGNSMNLNKRVGGIAHQAHIGGRTSANVGLIIINKMMGKMNQKFAIKFKDLAIVAYHFRLQICTVMAILSAVYVLLALFQIRVLVGFCMFGISVFGLLFFRWRNLKQQGIINTFSPKLKDLLLRRSIYDIYRDQVYYPYFTKIIGVFIKGAISKPHPQQLDQMFEEELPDNVKKAIFTKGILHLAPSKVQKIILQREAGLISEIEAPVEVKPKPQTLVPKSYGTVNQMWDRRTEYEGEVVKIHELTISKQILDKLNKKIKWGHVIVFGSLLSFLVMKTKGKKLGKVLLYNGSFMGIFILAALVVIKYKNPLLQYKYKLQRKLE